MRAEPVYWTLETATRLLAHSLSIAPSAVPYEMANAMYNAGLAVGLGRLGPSVPSQGDQTADAKPGDVLTGEQAKAYMLANPGESVAREGSPDDVYHAHEGEVWHENDVTWHSASKRNAFTGDEYRNHRYVVMPVVRSDA